jgi:hypothetical protein
MHVLLCGVNGQRVSARIERRAGYLFFSVQVFFERFLLRNCLKLALRTKSINKALII